MCAVNKEVRRVNSNKSKTQPGRGAKIESEGAQSRKVGQPKEARGCVGN